MKYEFKDSKLLQAQKAIEEYLKERFPYDAITILSRHRGNLENDVEAAVAQLGLCVAVEAALPTEYGGTVTEDVDIKAAIEVHVMEEQLILSSAPIEIGGVTVGAANTLEGIIKVLNTFRFENTDLVFKPVKNYSENAVLHYVLPIEFIALL